MQRRPLQMMLNRLRQHRGKYVLSWATRDDTRSDVPLTVMVPLAPKDVTRARRTLPMIRRNVAHPIQRLVIVAPATPEIAALGADLDADVIDEAAPLTDLLGLDAFQAMNGWHRQQMLKLAAPQVVGADRVLAFDSDTYPQRPTRFVDARGRTILYRADPDMIPYHRFTETLIGPAPGRALSFIAHCMLFERQHLDALHTAILAHTGKPWHRAVLDAIAAPYDRVGVMSEFDLYGHFLLRERRGALAMRHYANVKVGPSAFHGNAPQPWWRRRFRFVSNHQHGG